MESMAQKSKMNSQYTNLHTGWRHNCDTCFLHHLPYPFVRDPHKWASDVEFAVFFVTSLNKLLNSQSNCWLIRDALTVMRRNINDQKYGVVQVT